MTETAAAHSGRDFADLTDDGDIVRSIAGAKPVAQLPPNYRMTAKGLTWEKPTDKDTPDTRLIAGPFEVRAMTRDAQSESWGALLRWRDGDGVTHQMAAALSLLAGDGRDFRAALLSGGLYVSPATADRNALNAFLMQVKIDRRARAVSRVGWADGSFALPDRTIGPDDGDLVVYQGTASTMHDYRTAGTLEGWQSGLATLAAGNSRLVLAICAGFVGPLLQAVGGEGGGLHLRGASSIGKSTALLAAASIWGAPSFVRQWRATANGLEGVAELANETLLVLDELAQLDPKEAGSIAYMLANGCGKSRAGQSGEARSARRWTAFFLSSGEVSLAEHARSHGAGRRSAAGQDIRILDIEADAGAGLGLFDTLHGHADGDNLARTIKASAAAHHGHAGPAFVKALLGRMDETANTVRAGIQKFATDTLPPSASGQVHRACQRFGLLAMAGEVATFLEVLPWQPGEATRAAKAAFAGWMQARGGAGSAEDKTALEQVAEFLTMHGASRFQQIDAETNPVIHNRVGFIRKAQTGQTEYLIPPITWRNEVCKGLNAKSVSALLAEQGHLLTDTKGKTSIPVNAPGMGKTRFYIVRESVMGGADA